MSTTKNTKSTRKNIVKEAPLKVKDVPVVEEVKPVVPVVEAPVVEAPVVEAPVVVSEEVSTVITIKQRLEALLKSRMTALEHLKAEIVELKKLQKEYDVELKNSSKKTKKKKSEDGVKRKPSGFASPVTVSDQLYDFLSKYNVKKGDPIARTEVTKFITTYISENNLQNPSFRREIVPDATLKALFGEPIELKDKTDPKSPLVYTYLQLQRYLSPHFPKKAVVAK